MASDQPSATTTMVASKAIMRAQARATTLTSSVDMARKSGTEIDGLHLKLHRKCQQKAVAPQWFTT